MRHPAHGRVFQQMLPRPSPRLPSTVSFPFIQIRSDATELFIMPMSGNVMGDFMDDRTLHRASITLECQLVREFDDARPVSQEPVSGQRFRRRFPNTNITRQLVFLNEFNRHTKSDT